MPTVVDGQPERRDLARGQILFLACAPGYGAVFVLLNEASDFGGLGLALLEAARAAEIGGVGGRRRALSPIYFVPFLDVSTAR